MKKPIIQLVVNNTSCIRRDYARILVGAVVACWLVAAGTAKAQWFENFDAYANGSQAIGQGGWQGWDGDTTVGGLVTNAFAFSAPNSVRIRGTALTPGNYSDLVHQFSGYTSGQWTFSARVYIPSTSTAGTSFFILLDNYNNGGPYNWAIETHFDLAAGTVVETLGTSATVPIIRNQWVELRYLIDLTANTVSAFYNNTLLSTHVWQTGANGLNEIRAVDLYSDVSSPVFYDNISLTRVPKTISVNTADNTDFTAGKTNLVTAINMLADGDTIAFNIPGAGPHYVQTPSGGYPLITKHSVTIDGYSQPGSLPNTNSILATNNARIKIVLTSTNDNFTSLDYNSSTNTQAGFGPSSFALLGIYGATNVQIRGLCLLGGSVGGLSDHFAIAMARDSTHATMGVHVNGCWIGVAPDGTTVKDFDDAIHASSARYEASYRFRGTNAGCVFDITLNNRNPGVWESDRELWTIFRATNTCPELPLPAQPTINASAGRYVHFNHVIGVKAGSLNPRAEFNVIVGGTIPIIMEGYGFRISGNFLGVLPDGVTQYLVPVAQPGRFAESFIEIGRGVSDLVIGTDGDGVNDADERNVIAGVVTDGSKGSINRNGYRHCVEFYSASGALNATNGPGDDRQRIRVSGNYIGIGVDGTTRFTNGVSLLNGSSTTGTHYVLGSDFDGVSDAIEGNVFYGNYPPGYFYAGTAYTNSTVDGSGSHGFFDEPDPNAGGFSTRGNKIVNNYPYPANPRRTAPGTFGTNVTFVFITTYVNKALAVAQPATAAGFYGLMPVISSSSTTARLIGTAPANNTNYPYLILDVYLPDPEGLTNGLVVPDPFLTNGWVHGKTYLGSFVDNGVLDSDPTVGSFNFSMCGLGLTAGSRVTVSANYSKDVPGTHNARVLTSLFANPVAVAAGTCLTNLIAQIVETGGDNETNDTITAKWTGQTFPVSVAGEPLPGLAIGANYTVGPFGNGAATFVDRAHSYTNASDTVLIPSYLVGGEYIMSGNDNRDNTNLTMDVTVSRPVDVYLLIDNRLGDGSGANPPTFTITNMQWVLDQGWVAVTTGINRTADRNIPDEVGIDEDSNGSINNWYSIYTKAFPAGTFQLKQADNTGRNMYGAVITVQRRMAIGRQGANVVITFPAGYRLQRATSVNGPWTDVSGTSPVTEPASAGERYYRGVSP